MVKGKASAAVLVFTMVFSSLAGQQLANFAAGNFLPPPPELPHVYIRADGAFEPQTLPMRRIGDTYTLTGNMFNVTLEVQRENVIVDGAGFVLHGNNTGVGILVNGISNVAIKNLRISNFRLGIQLTNASNIKLSRNIIVDNEMGIILTSSSGNQITGSTLTGNIVAILLSSSCVFNSISENTITKNEQAISLQFLSYNSTNDDNSISANNISDNQGCGVRLYGSANCRIENNNITGNQYGVSLSGSSCNYNAIVGNKFIGNLESNIGLYADSKYAMVTLNTIADSKIGLDIFNANYNNIFLNDFFYNTVQVNNGYIREDLSVNGASTNSWDRNSQGNFWSDRSSTNSTYIIDAFNVDHFPLSSPYNGMIAQPKPAAPVLSMLVEYINYTISILNGGLWANVDGVYPMHLSSEAASMPLLYPVPPGTTEIQVKLDGQELSWSNRTATDGSALHHTDIGDWSMISCLVSPASSDFTLEIHYRHPVQVINGSYVVLYDLNISPYLSVSNPVSTAIFKVRVEANFSNIAVYTTGLSGTWNPVNFSTERDGAAETLTFNVVSEYIKPSLGDVVIVLGKEQQIPEFPAWTPLPLMLALIMVFCFWKSRKTMAGSKS